MTGFPWRGSGLISSVAALIAVGAIAATMALVDPTTSSGRTDTPVARSQVTELSRACVGERLTAECVRQWASLLIDSRLRAGGE